MLGESTPFTQCQSSEIKGVQVQKENHAVGVGSDRRDGAQVVLKLTIRTSSTFLNIMNSVADAK